MRHKLRKINKILSLILTLGLVFFDVPLVMPGYRADAASLEPIDTQEQFRPFDGWRVMPIRSEEEYAQAKIGGEGEQNMHGLVRSPSNPNVIYASQDLAGPWKSINAGETWRKTLGKGLYANYAYSIEVDPVNPDIVFIVVCSLWDGGTNDAFEGLYRSTDGSDSWEHVLPIVLDAQDANYQAERRYQHNIAYDFSSREANGARIWYAAFLNKGLYKSDNYGDKGSWVKVADLSEQGAIYEIEVNPSDGSVYIASEQGLLKYTQAGGLQAFGDLPSGKVPSIEINLQDPNIVYATLTNGLYKSTDKGNTFSLLKQKQGTLLRVFVNQGYPDAIYLMGAGGWPQSPTIITHDGGQTWIQDVSEINVYYLPGVLETDYHKYLDGWNSGAVVPNPQNDNEAVIFTTNGRFYKTTDAGHNWLRSTDLFTGYAVWLNSGFAFDKFNPNRFALFLCDVIIRITKNGGDWFYRLTNTTAGNYIRSDWRNQWLIPASGATGSYSGAFQPIANSETMVATIGDYPVGQEKVRVMYLENESSGWELATYNKLVRAEHLDENKNFISDIYNAVKTKDNTLSEEIPVGHYVRATFEQNFTAHHSVSIYTDKAGATIEVYAGNTLITTFSNTWDKQYKASLSNLTQEVNILDFKIASDPIKFDYIYESKLYRMWFLGYHTNEPNIVYAGELISHDAGRTFQRISWTKVGGGDFTNLNPKIIGMCNSNPDTVYALGGNQNTILRSDDKGETWYLYSQPGWNFKIIDAIPTFTVDPQDPNKVYTLYRDKDLAVFNGTEWRKLGVIDLVEKPENYTLAVRTVAIDPNHPEIIYASIDNNGVSDLWRSIDAGETWEDISYNLPRKGSWPIAVNPHTGEVFAGGSAGTWILPPPKSHYAWGDDLIYNKAYSMPSCYDGLKNGDETGIDCGGSCCACPVSFLYGDVNADSEISAYDAALAAHIAVALEHPDIKNRSAAEVSGDAEVTAYDAALIAQKAVGLIDKFPVE